MHSDSVRLYGTKDRAIEIAGISNGDGMGILGFFLLPPVSLIPKSYQKLIFLTATKSV